MAARILEPFEWPPDRLQRTDACEQHHARRAPIAIGLEVELMRRSDLVDVTTGLASFGLDRRWLRELFREVPRDGLCGTSSARRSSASCATARRPHPTSSSPHDAHERTHHHRPAFDDGVEVRGQASVGESDGEIALVGKRAVVEEGARLESGARFPEDKND
jgi:hypothetical protein